MTIGHDHVLDIVLVCRDCGLVLADEEEAIAVRRRLIRYVAPKEAPVITTSDNLTNAEPWPFVFDLTETTHQ